MTEPERKAGLDRRRLAAALVAGILVLALGTSNSPATASADSAMPPSASPSPTVKSGYTGQDPPGWDEFRLSDLGRTAHRTGTDRFPDAFTAVALDPCRCSVTVYMTDLAQKDRYLAALLERAPGVDATRVNFAQGKNTWAVCGALLPAVRGVLDSRNVPFFVPSAALDIACGAVELRVDNLEAAQEFLGDPAHRIWPYGVTVRATQADPNQKFMPISYLEPGAASTT